MFRQGIKPQLLLDDVGNIRRQTSYQLSYFVINLSWMKQKPELRKEKKNMLTKTVDAVIRSKWFVDFIVTPFKVILKQCVKWREVTLHGVLGRIMI